MSGKAFGKGKVKDNGREEGEREKGKKGKKSMEHGHYAHVHAFLLGLKLADPGITSEPRGLSATQPGLADIFTAAAVLARSAALNVCVASSNAAARRGAAQALIANCPTTGMKSQA